MSKKRILITTSTYPRWQHDSTPGFVQQFAQELTRQDFDVEVVAPHVRGAKTYEKNQNVTVRRFRYFFPASAQDIAYSGGGIDKIRKTPLYAMKLLCFMASLFFTTWWYSVTHKIDVINPHWAVPQGFVAVLVKFLTGKRVILTVHGSDVFSLNGKVMNKIKTFTLKYSDEVCVNSNATKKRCREIYNRDYRVIPMGIHMDKFDKDKAGRPTEDNSIFEILYVGRFAKIKGVEYLLEALRLLKDDGLIFHAAIAGDSGLRSSYEAYVKQNQLTNVITFPGWIDQEKLKRLYNRADIFVGPSLSEAQGLVFIEALASGTPVIATNVGGIPDIVKDGHNGYLVEPKNAVQIYEKLSYIIRNQRVVNRLADNARSSVLDKFSWQSVAEAYKRVMVE